MGWAGPGGWGHGREEPDLWVQVVRELRKDLHVGSMDGMENGVINFSSHEEVCCISNQSSIVRCWVLHLMPESLQVVMAVLYV